MPIHSKLRINQERLLADVQALAAIGKQSSGGINRHSFTPEYRAACDWLIGQMQAAGMSTRIDLVGNVIGRTGPDEGAVVMTGSHIDTVHNGGPLDGSLGVLAGIEVTRVITENNIELAAPLEVVAFNDEEGAFLSLLGAMAMSGTINDEDVENAVNFAGQKLTDAMAGNGFDPANVRNAAYPAGAIKKYIELHIEQGPVLENLNLDIGVVEGIVCQRNIDYTFSGLSNHAGTTPMIMRKDAFRAAAEFVTRCYALLDEEGNANASTRMTFGTCAIKPGYPNVIPCETTVRLDSRDLDQANSAQLATKVAAVAEQVAEQYSVGVQIEVKCVNPAALMAPSLVDSIKSCADKLGYSSQVMPSGAGHDAQALALVADAGMIFVPSIRGLSHHPDEWTAPEHLEKGTNVLLHALLAQLL